MNRITERELLSETPRKPQRRRTDGIIRYVVTRRGRLVGSANGVDRATAYAKAEKIEGAVLRLVKPGDLE